MTVGTHGAKGSWDAATVLPQTSTIWPVFEEGDPRHAPNARNALPYRAPARFRASPLSCENAKADFGQYPVDIAKVDRVHQSQSLVGPRLSILRQRCVESSAGAVTYTPVESCASSD